jgi:hypothetical protein
MKLAAVMQHLYNPGTFFGRKYHKMDKCIVLPDEHRKGHVIKEYYG